MTILYYTSITMFIGLNLATYLYFSNIFKQYSINNTNNKILFHNISRYE